MSENMIELQSSDGVSFTIEKEVAFQSVMIKHMDEARCTEDGIPIKNVTSEILKMVIDYCKMHAVSDSLTDGKSKEVLKKWDAKFMKNMEPSTTLFDVMTAANYLNIKGLLDLTSQTVADMLSTKTPDEIRACFNIENDLSPDEEAKIARRIHGLLNERADSSKTFFLLFFSVLFSVS